MSECGFVCGIPEGDHLTEEHPWEPLHHVAVDCPVTREPGLREAARDLYSIAVGEHGHDETHSADWPSCLPAHMAMNRARAALASEDRPMTIGTASTQTFCSRCNHPMHWKVCGVERDGLPSSCRCRNDAALEEFSWPCSGWR